MSLPTETRAVLKKLLTVVTHRATALLEILEQEHTALLTPRPDALPAITERKIAALRDLESADQVLNDYSARLADSGSPGSLPRLIEDCPECLTRWEALSDTLAVLREYNQRNGAILNKNQQRVTQIITILTGREPLPDYNRQGSLSLGGRSRSLAKA